MGFPIKEKMRKDKIISFNKNHVTYLIKHFLKNFFNKHVKIDNVWNRMLLKNAYYDFYIYFIDLLIKANNVVVGLKRPL